MQAVMEEQADELAELHSAFRAMAADTKNVPGTVDDSKADDATALTVSTMTQADMVRLIRSVNKEENGNGHKPRDRKPRDHSTRTQTTPNTNTWRQWKFFCHTHGVNLNHASGDCPRPNEGHKKEATKCSPCSGNEKRNHLWMKWCDPVSHEACDSPGA